MMEWWNNGIMKISQKVDPKDLFILSEAKNLTESRGYRSFTEPILSEILQSLRSFRMTTSEGFEMTKRDFLRSHQ
jgi:hypothetical protein